jgi:hypothetical protein
MKSGDVFLLRPAKPEPAMALNGKIAGNRRASRQKQSPEEINAMFICRIQALLRDRRLSNAGTSGRD